jgi:predicted RNA-binding protein with RPS1 domain
MFQPLPDPAAINKCIREWQVGSSRTHRLVHALCDPFGEEKLSNLGNPPAVMDRVPKPGDLRPGDEVVGVVASVAAFGAFVEISPEATGLIRVSRLAEEFVEEIHDYIQVGDIVTAWVTEVDQRRKLQLSAISPQREEELRARRQEMRENRNQRGSGPRRGQGGGSPREGQASGGQASGGQAARDGAPRRDGGAVGTAGRGRNDGGRPQSGQGGQGGRGEPRRGGRDDRRGGDHRGRDRGARREEPISYTTRVPKSQAPAPPISEAMAEGKEPLRSFGDLLQFFKKDTPTPPTEVKPGGQKPKPAKDAAKPTEESESQSAAGQAAETGGGHEAGAGDGQSDAAVATGDRLAGPTATNESQA